MLIERLIRESGLTEKQLGMYAHTASKRYFVFSIPKRNGERRWIAHPARPIKAIQRWLNSRLINSWNVHQSATAYQKGSSIRSNAFRHANTNYTLRLDFKDFFPSFKSDGIEKFLLNKINSESLFDENDISFIINIVTRNGELTIGAPTSPILTNAMMFEFDDQLSKICEVRGIVYTRYADDLFFSTRQANVLGDLFLEILNTADNYPYATLQFNGDKTKYLSRKYNRTITGLVITPDGRVSLGRDRKREIKALIHQTITKRIDDQKLLYLKGMIAFCSDADHSFYEALVKKYGQGVLSKLLR